MMAEIRAFSRKNPGRLEARRPAWSQAARASSIGAGANPENHHDQDILPDCRCPIDIAGVERRRQTEGPGVKLLSHVFVSPDMQMQV
jgi:hypothetical protein